MQQWLNTGVSFDISDLERNIQSSLRLLNQFGQTVNRVSSQLGTSIQSGVEQSVAALRQLSYNGQNIGNQLNRSFQLPIAPLTNLASGFLSAQYALNLFKQGLSIVSDIERVNASLKAVSTSTYDFARSQAYLQTLSNNLGLAYDTLASSYKGLKAATNGTVLEGRETEKIFSSVVRAGAALKLSNDDIKGSLMALTQMLSKGTVSMEEMRQQLGERLPAAFSLAAKAMGVSQGELNKMIASGQVMAVDLLPKLAVQLEKTYGSQAQSNVNTMAGGFERAKTQLSLFIAEFAKTKGIDTFFTKVTNGIANMISGMRRSQAGSMQSEIDDFTALSPEDQKKQQIKLASRILEYESKLKDAQNAPLNSKNLAREVEFEKRLNYMRSLYGQMYLIVRDGETKAQKAQADAKANAGRFDIDKAKDRQSALAKQIQNLVGDGQAVPAKLRQEYDNLSAKIERATEATKRHRDSHLAAQPTLTTEEAILKRLTYELKQYGDTADGSRSRQVKLFDEIVKQQKTLADFKPVDISKYSSKPVAIPNQVDAKISDFGSTVGGYYASMADMVKSKIQAISRMWGTLTKISKADVGEVQLPGLDKLQDRLAQMAKGLNKGLSAPIREAMNDMHQAIKNGLQNASQSALIGMGELIGNMIAGTASLADLPKMIGMIFADLAKTMGQAMIAFGTAGLAAKVFLKNPVTAIVAGVALVALGSAMQSMMAEKSNAAFAKGYEGGGLFNAESLIRVGETSKARMGGGEWVSPVDKGADLISARIMKNIGGLNPTTAPLPSRAGIETQTFKVNVSDVKVRGSDLILVFDRAKRSNAALGNG